MTGKIEGYVGEKSTVFPARVWDRKVRRWVTLGQFRGLLSRTKFCLGPTQLSGFGFWDDGDAM